MKKWITIVSAGMLALALSACGQTAEPKKDPVTGKEEEVVVKSDLTAEEVLEKANAAAETQQSMHMEMDVDQTIEMGDEKQDVKSTVDSEIILEPLAMRQTVNMQVAGEEMAVEQYITEDGIFMKDPESGEWMKLPNEMYEQMSGQMADSMSSPVDYSIYEEFGDDFTFEQTNDEYILKLKGSGEKFSSVVKETMEQNMPAGMDEQMLEVISNMKIESIDLEFTVDKETFFTKDLDMKMIMTMEEDGEQVKITQSIKGTISKINEIEEIKVPKEIIDNAVDMGDAMEEAPVQ